MNGMSMLKRVVGIGVAACCMSSVSPLAAANADSSAASYSATITANPAAAVVSQDALLVNLLPQVPTRVLRPVVGLWGLTTGGAPSSMCRRFAGL